MIFCILCPYRCSYGFKIAFFSEAFLYIRLCWANHLVGNCLFPRMSKKYDCYILLNRITSTVIAVRWSSEYTTTRYPLNISWPWNLPSNPTQQSGEKTGGAGYPNRADRAGNQDAGGPEWRSKAWPRMSQNPHDILGTTTVVNCYFTARSSFGEYVVLVRNHFKQICCRQIIMDCRVGTGLYR